MLEIADKTLTIYNIIFLILLLILTFSSFWFISKSIAKSLLISLIISPLIMFAGYVIMRYSYLISRKMFAEDLFFLHLFTNAPNIYCVWSLFMFFKNDKKHPKDKTNDNQCGGGVL